MAEHDKYDWLFWRFMCCTTAFLSFTLESGIYQSYTEILQPPPCRSTERWILTKWSGTESTGQITDKLWSQRKVQAKRRRPHKCVYESLHIFLCCTHLWEWGHENCLKLFLVDGVMFRETWYVSECCWILFANTTLASLCLDKVWHVLIQNLIYENQSKRNRKQFGSSH